MKKMLIVAVLAAACGGKSKPATEPKPDTTEHKEAPAEEKAAVETPAETKPAEAKPDDAALAQAALAEQYDLGKKVYTDKKCASCHGDHGEGNKKNPPVIGEKALPEKPAKTAKLRKGVTFKTAADVEAFVKAKMPVKAPNTLSDDEAFAVTAWLLSESKVAIDKKVDADNAAAINVH